MALRSWNYVKDAGINTEEVYPYQGEVCQIFFLNIDYTLLVCSLYRVIKYEWIILRGDDITRKLCANIHRAITEATLPVGHMPQGPMMKKLWRLSLPHTVFIKYIRFIFLKRKKTVIIQWQNPFVIDLNWLGPVAISIDANEWDIYR